MQTRKAARNLVVMLLIAAACTGAQAATSKIGVTAAVKNDVQGVQGATTRPLSTGSDVFRNERIKTGENSLAQILFLDKTTLVMGARAELVLDKFVYSPRGIGQVALNAVQGAFRFVTGSQNPRSYSINTPLGSIGIRGTVVELLVSPNATTPTTYTVYVILVQGALTFTYKGRTYTLSNRGDYFVITEDGVNGPAPWNSTVVNADVMLPLFGWTFDTELPDSGLPDLNINGIDQINGVTQPRYFPD
jgi:hypothetical protein